MEAHSLRFVRCPRCHQLLVEYPSIPVYKCGGCGTVLKAKHRAVLPAAAQGGSESEDCSGSLKGSPQNSGSACSAEQKAVDRPCEAATRGRDSSSIDDASSRDGPIHERSMSVTDDATGSERMNGETCSAADGGVQNSRIVAKEVHDQDTGADSSSNLTEKFENVHTSGNALYEKEKDEAVHRKERLHTYDGVHVESHKALIEELEKSLSFSSDDDDYFSDEAENSGLSDALRNQMGSRRFVLGDKMNDAPRSDPHGRLIEELEMSFSDEEEPPQHHAVVADGNFHGDDPQTLGDGSAHRCEEKPQQHAVVADGNFHVNDPQTLGDESARPCEESLSSFDNGHLSSEQPSLQEKGLIGNAIEGNEYIEDDNNTANCVHGSEHIVIADDEIAEGSHEEQHGKDCKSADIESAYPFETSTSSVNDGNIKVEQIFEPNDLTAYITQEVEEVHVEDDKVTNHIDENDNLVLADEDIAERVCGNEQLAADGTQEMEEGCMEDDDTANCVNGNDNLVLAGENSAERVHGNEELTTDGTQEMEDGNMANCVHGYDNLVLADEDIAERVCGNEQLAAIGTQEMEEGHMEDDSMSNCFCGNDNLVFADETIAERVNGYEETAGGTEENEESCMKIENETVAIADEDIAKKVNENEHCMDQQSLAAEGAHLCEGEISSPSSGHAKSEQNFQQDVPTVDGTRDKEEDYMEDGASCVQENSAAVARFPTLPDKRTQCKFSSFNKNKEQMNYSQLRQGRSLDSEDFNSIQNFMESQMDGTSSFISSGSPSQGDLVHRPANKFNNIVRHERLKKMDELRDQLSRLSSQKGSERSYQKRGLEYQQQSNSYDVEQHLQSVDGDSLPSSCALESYYGHGRPPRYQPPNPFSPTHTYTHYHHYGHAQTCLPHNYDPWEFDSYYQASYTESTILDHESLMSSYKEPRRVVRKHILRPLSGASPFTICSSCFNLVQMPSDIYISKAKVGKMQCGKCSKVLALSFPAVHNANAKINVDVPQESYSHDDSMVAKNDDISSYFAECLAVGPVSMSEDYGASYTRSLPAEAGPSSLAATQSGKKVSDSALHRLMGYESASQLLRHSRVFEDGYESFESMVPVSSRVSRRKNT
ncbi:hypothetical protein U9M48_005522 [Paspalum notatum var. saurae]|uniref:Zinc-ribbon domain-containing protein n=1 Tax=Paspalum notatum var. saurae TaxID=547442 RepID=A0AAQ3SFI9_PASNO